MSNDNDDSGQAGNLFEWIEEAGKTLDDLAKHGAAMGETLSETNFSQIDFSQIDFPKIPPHLVTAPLSFLQEERWKSLLAKTAEMLAKAPERHRKAASYLIKRSWYMPGYFHPGDAYRIVQLSEAGRHEEVEQLMVSTMQDCYPYAKNDILDSFPERRHLLEAAFWAHEEEKYALSIPLLLAQADGAHEDVMRTAIYSSDSNRLKNNLIKKIEARGNQSAKDSFLYLMLLPLTEEDASIREDTRDRPAPPPGIPTEYPLNRNGVLHGIDLDYAVEANSLRALAFFSVVADAKRLLDDSME